MQHGQFYAHQQYLAQQGRIVTSQNPNLGNRGDVQQGHHRGQPTTLVNGQAYATHVAQQQPRTQAGQPTAAEMAMQYDLLQNPAFYNHALQQQRQQAQTLTRQQQEQQQRLLRQQQQQADPSTSLRNLLATSYQRTALDQLNNQLQQNSLRQHTLPQFGLGNQATSSHIPSNLQQHGVTSKHGSTQQHSRIINEHQRREIPQSNETSVLVNPSTVQSSLRNRQQTISQELISRHLSPATGQTTTGFYPNMGANIYQNLLITPNMNPNNATGIISPQGGAYSSALGHLPRGPVSRLPTRSTELPTLNNIGYDNQSRSASRDLQSLQKLTTTGPVINTHVHVKRQTSSVNSCAAPVIISDSDDEDDEPQQPSTSSSGQKKESKRETVVPNKSLRVVIDDDLEIVGMKEAEVMSHMRSDCPIHNFKRIDAVSEKPQTENIARCSKCFCYVCDKISSECPSWTDATFPHCNAHSRASCWKARRNTKKSPLMLKLSGDDLSPEVEQAGVLAMQYMIKIRELYITYRAGTPCEYLKVPCNCTCHSTQADPCPKCKVVHDMKKKFNYEPVREIALSIIREIQAKYSKTNPHMALIMLEAVLSELCSQRPADFNHSIRMPSNPDPRCQCNFPNIIEEHIEKELVEIFTRHEIPTSFRNHLTQCVEKSIQPLQLENIMKRFLNMRHWDNIHLRTVLTGGINNRREVLRETADVVKLRVEKLDRDKRYQGILRYLRAVKILQSSKSTVSNQQIMELMEQWNILYSAKQGHFRDVVLRLTEPIADKKLMLSPGCALGQYQPHFLLEVLDALAGVGVLPNTRLDSFDAKTSQGHYQIIGKDAEVLMVLFQLIVQNNPLATNHVPFYIWLAKWVNRIPLSRCVDPHKIKQWADTGKQIIDCSKRFYARAQCQSLIMQSPVQDPHVHLFMASLNIINAVSKLGKTFKPQDIQDILNAYKNNEWSLFNLLTQSVMMNFGDVNIIRWIINFCKANNVPVAQIEDRVLIESIQSYPLDCVADLMNSLIKSDWINSVETIQRTVIALCSEYSLRLLEELKRHDVKVLSSMGKWLEEIILNHVVNNKVAISLRREDIALNYLKNTAKTCCIMNPSKRNIDIYKLISGPEWYRRSNALIQFLQEKFTKERLSGTIEEFSTLLWLLWDIDDLDRMSSYFLFFEDKHSCVDLGKKLSSGKVLQEVMMLLGSSFAPNTLQKKSAMVEKCKRLITLETLSWLTCAKCAEKMPTGWTNIWISVAKSKLDENIKELNRSMLMQFKMWLNSVSLDNPESYKRLLNCLRTFIVTLVDTWKKCSISFEQARNLLLETSKTINACVLQQDFVSIANETIEKEIAKTKPKVEEARLINHIRPGVDMSSSKPPETNHMGQQRVQHVRNHISQQRVPNQPDPLEPQKVKLEPATTGQQRVKNIPGHIGEQKVSSVPDHREQQRVQNVLHGPPPLIKNKGTETKTTSELLKSPPRKEPPPPREELNTTTKVHAVMSTNALFKKSTQNKTPSRSVSHDTTTSVSKDQGPFSPSNPTRTKICQKCGETISCASFRCPKCNQATRSIQPVNCPGCGQENRELKGYSCQFCYRSLLDILFRGGGKTGEVCEEEKKTENFEDENQQKRKKKKSSEKRRKKSKIEETLPKPNFEPKESITERKISPLTLKITKQRTLDDSSDTSLDDFVTEKTEKRRKRHISNSRVPPIKLKRKPSAIVTSPKPHQSLMVSLTDEDSDSSENEIKKTVINSSEEFFNTNKKFQEKVKKTEVIKPIPAKILPKQISPPKPPQDVGETSGSKNQIPKPQFYNSPISNRVAQTNESVSPQRATNAAAPVNAGPAKRGVGHSSMMSKKQKNILSRLKRPGGQKNAPSPKTTPPSVLTKEPIRSPNKRPSIDNGSILSPPRNVEIMRNERQRHDSSCSSGSISSVASGLSFGFASVDQKKSPNVGRRTGGPPSSKKFESNRFIYDEVTNSKKTLLPRPLNSADKKMDKMKKKKHKKRKEKKTITLTERKLDIMISKRSAGPASKTGYKRLLKLSQKLKKMQKSTPHKNWRLPPHVKVPKRVDLSRHAIVSLSPFPLDKLRKIRNLVPHYKIDNLFT